MSKQEYKEKMQKIKAQFEAEVVRPVEAVILGLNKDTVYWQKGLLSTPPVSTHCKTPVFRKDSVVIESKSALFYAWPTCSH